jgi:hypothetical protein
MLERLAHDTYSPIRLSRELDEPLGNCSHQISTLHEFGLIELVDTRPRRGAIEHYYRARWKVRVEVEPVE